MEGERGERSKSQDARPGQVFPEQIVSAQRSETGYAETNEAAAGVDRSSSMSEHRNQSDCWTSHHKRLAVSGSYRGGGHKICAAAVHRFRMGEMPCRATDRYEHIERQGFEMARMGLA